MNQSTHINLRMLSYLVALADTRHFGKAADACFVSQPTLSAQIRKLEEQLGVTLLERQPRNLLLTPVGEQIVERARKMLRDAAEIEDLARLNQDPLAGVLRMGLIPTLGPYLLPHVVEPLRRQLPGLRSHFLEYQTDPLLDQIADGHIDVGFLALPIEAEGIVVRELFDEPFRLAVPADHALAAEAPVRLDDLTGERLMLLEDGHCLRDQALEVCALSGIAEEPGFRATSLETLRQMVAAGAGMTLLPALATEAPNPAIRTLRFADPQPLRHVAAAWRATSPRTESIAAVCEVIRRSVPKGVVHPA